MKSLPASLGDARAHFLEGKTCRWLSSVNALPGGLPARDVMTNHRPEPKQHPGLVVVGDYLFDSTLNGLLDSSDAATDIIVTEMMKLRRARRKGASDRIDRGYFENYRGLGPYHEVWSQFTDPTYLTDLIKIVWNRTKGYKLLVAGSASGELVAALRDRGIDAFEPGLRAGLDSRTMLPFPHPAHRTGQACFRHPALGESFTRSPTGDCSSA